MTVEVKLNLQRNYTEELYRANKAGAIMVWFGAGIFFIGTTLLLAYVLFGKDQKEDDTPNHGTRDRKKDGNYTALLRKYMNKGKIDEIEKIIDQLDGLSEENRQEVKAFVFSNGLLERFTGLLSERDYQVRVKAVNRLGLIGGSGTVRVIFEAMADKNEEVRMAAAEAIRRLNDPSIVPELIMALSYPNKWLPARIAETLLFFGAQSIPAMIDALEKEEPLVKAYLIEILGEIEDPGVLFPLSRCLKDSNSQVRLQAVRALGKIQEKETEEMMIGVLDDPEPKVQIQVLRTLALKKGAFSAGIIGNKLTSNEPRVRLAAFDLLRNMGAEGLEIIRQTADSQDHPMAAHSSEHLRSMNGK